jgi:hypothetical protein
MSLPAFAPLIVAGLMWVVYLLRDIRRADVRLLPKWAWALVVTFAIPIGGILYLVGGRSPHGRAG